jgi:putative membrane protein
VIRFGSLMGHSSIAHEIARSLYKLRRLGCLEAVGPAGYNAMQTLIQNMTDQLGNMERIV